MEIGKRYLRWFSRASVIYCFPETPLSQATMVSIREAGVCCLGRGISCTPDERCNPFIRNFSFYRYRNGAGRRGSGTGASARKLRRKTLAPMPPGFCKTYPLWRSTMPVQQIYYYAGSFIALIFARLARKERRFSNSLTMCPGRWSRIPT